MQITSAACAPRFEIHFDPTVHDRDSHHRRLRVALHASDAGPLGRGYDFSPASSAATAGADSSAIVSLAASAPSASVAASAAASASAAAAFSAAAIFLLATCSRAALIICCARSALIPSTSNAVSSASDSCSADRKPHW